MTSRSQRDRHDTGTCNEVSGLRVGGGGRGGNRLVAVLGPRRACAREEQAVRRSDHPSHARITQAGASSKNRQMWTPKAAPTSLFRGAGAGREDGGHVAEEPLRVLLGRDRAQRLVLPPHRLKEVRNCRRPGFQPQDSTRAKQCVRTFLLGSVSREEVDDANVVLLAVAVDRATLQRRL